MHTIEVAAPADTHQLVAALRPAHDLPTGRYRLRTGRCVVELALCVLRRPVVRGRITASGGTLTAGELGTLELDLSPASLRGGVPFTRGVLAAGLGPEPLALRVRIVHATEDTVVLTASGRLPKRFRRVELAAEFVSGGTS